MQCDWCPSKWNSIRKGMHTQRTSRDSEGSYEGDAVEAKESQRWLATTEVRRGVEDSPSQPSEHLDLRLLASRSVRS